MEQEIVFHYVWSRDGETLFYGASDWTGNTIKTVDVDTGTVSTVKAFEGECTPVYLSLSEDELFVAEERDLGEKTGATLWKITLSTGDAYEIWHVPENCRCGFGGSFSPDGLFVYRAVERNAQYDLVKLDLAIGEETVLCTLPTISWIAISHDAQHLAFSDGNRLHVMKSDGGSPLCVTDLCEQLGEIEWSPDDQWISYHKRDDSEYRQIFKLHPDGGPEIQVTDDMGWHDGLGWSEDGTRFVFSKAVPGCAHEICIVDAEGGREIPLTAYTSVNPYSFGPDAWVPSWSPKGDRIAYIRTIYGKADALCVVEPEAADTAIFCREAIVRTKVSFFSLLSTLFKLKP